MGGTTINDGGIVYRTLYETIKDYNILQKMKLNNGINKQKY